MRQRPNAHCGNLRAALQIGPQRANSHEKNQHGVILLPNDRGLKYEVIEVMDVVCRSCKKPKVWQEDKIDLVAFEKKNRWNVDRKALVGKQL